MKDGRPHWFGVLGEVIFATVEGRDKAPATFEWGATPQGWIFASDLDRKGRLNVQEILESFILAGDDIRLIELQAAGGAVRLALRGQWTFSDKELADLLKRVVEVERKFWRDQSEPFFVALVPLPPVPEGTFHAGIGRGDGFVLYASTNSGLSGFLWELAHEHMHAWIPTELGGLRKQDEAIDYWFSEGFADYYSSLALLDSGIWNFKDFVSEQNEALRRYARSPAKGLSNTQVAKEFWTQDAARQLPYDRGRMLAILLDYDCARSPAVA